jgi:hypothetical protein
VLLPVEELACAPACANVTELDPRSAPARTTTVVILIMPRPPPIREFGFRF